MAADGAPVISQAAVGVAHGVGVFAHDEGPRVIPSGHAIGDEFDGWVHGADDVRHAPAAAEGVQGEVPLATSGADHSFVMHGAGGANCTQRATVTALITRSL